MIERGHVFIGRQFLNAWSEKYIDLMEELLITHSLILKRLKTEYCAPKEVNKAKRLCGELRRQLGPFFELSRTLALLTNPT